MSTHQHSVNRKHLTWLFTIIMCIAGCKQPDKNQNANNSVMITGNVIGYLSNRIGDMDKLLINVDGQQQTFHFPPFAAQEIMQLAPVNSVVKLIVHPNKKKPGNELQQINIGDKTIIVADIRPPTAATNETVELSSKINRYKLDDHGHISGIIIDSFLIDIPPPMIKNLEPLLTKSANIIVKGYQRNQLDGFVNNTGLLIVKPFSISIDKTTYVL